MKSIINQAKAPIVLVGIIIGSFFFTDMTSNQMLFNTIAPVMAFLSLLTLIFWMVGFTQKSKLDRRPRHGAQGFYYDREKTKNKFDHKPKQ